MFWIKSNEAGKFYVNMTLSQFLIDKYVVPSHQKNVFKNDDKTRKWLD